MSRYRYTVRPIASHEWVLFWNTLGPASSSDLIPMNGQFNVASLCQWGGSRQEPWFGSTERYGDYVSRSGGLIAWSLACHVIPDVSYGLATPELIDAVSSGLLTPHELQESSNWSKDIKLFCRTLKFGPLLRAITGRDIAKDMNDMPVLSLEVEPEQVGGKRKVVLQGATFEGDDDDIFGWLIAAVATRMFVLGD